jgi:hypothetical protein
MIEIGTLRITTTPHRIRLGRLSRPVTPGRRGGGGGRGTIQNKYLFSLYMFSLYLIIRELILSLRKGEGYRAHTHWKMILFLMLLVVSRTVSPYGKL